jgi:hypothetical protein
MIKQSQMVSRRAKSDFVGASHYRCFREGVLAVGLASLVSI